MDGLSNVIAYECISCGAYLSVSNNLDSVTCSYCGTQQYIKQLNNIGSSVQEKTDVLGWAGYASYKTTDI